MTPTSASSPLPSLARAIMQRTRGRTLGSTTRLMSPSDFGEILKPFVFLDFFDYQGAAFTAGLHPHSGIATLSYILEGSVNYIDPDKVKGTVPVGGVEWMQAGRGMWHGGGINAGRTRGFQLWIALPPKLEAGRRSSAHSPRQLRVRIERDHVSVADQLSRATLEGRRALALRATAGPHRPLDRGRIRHRVSSRRVAARRLGGFRAVERSGRVRGADRR